MSWTHHCGHSRLRATILGQREAPGDESIAVFLSALPYEHREVASRKNHRVAQQGGRAFRR
ncbi:hypothetical protein XAB3213_4610003 [Xanthomonas citri pv. bilvae]|nr:hypothetical protein XAB3213_4610003 [Xanthomonas citri pv. bilvae]